MKQKDLSSFRYSLPLKTMQDIMNHRFLHKGVINRGEKVLIKKMSLSNDRVFFKGEKVKLQ